MPRTHASAPARDLAQATTVPREIVIESGGWSRQQSGRGIDRAVTLP